MQVHVRLAEPFWRAVGQRRLQMEVGLNARVSDLLALLCSQFPALETELAEASPHIFVGDAEASMDTGLKEGDNVHLVWPIAGG